jgi:hypothetical protein
LFEMKTSLGAPHGSELVSCDTLKSSGSTMRHAQSLVDPSCQTHVQRQAAIAKIYSKSIGYKPAHKLHRFRITSLVEFLAVYFL